mmetsp:Transcript_20137/g.27772  ORF Transcript_20137/g.27772 Transcript_20137/m.27772 type:complete len:201 (+) Transcript_20137:57-659(+)
MVKKCEVRASIANEFYQEQREMQEALDSFRHTSFCTPSRSFPPDVVEWTEKTQEVKQQIHCVMMWSNCLLSLSVIVSLFVLIFFLAIVTITPLAIFFVLGALLSMIQNFVRINEISDLSTKLQKYCRTLEHFRPPEDVSQSNLQEEFHENEIGFPHPNVFNLEEDSEQALFSEVELVSLSPTREIEMIIETRETEMIIDL